MISLAVSIGIALLSMAANYYLSSRPEKQKRDDSDQSSFPVVDDSSSIPIIYGNVTLTGGNLVWAQRNMYKGEDFVSVGCHIVFCQDATYYFTLELEGAPVAGHDFYYGDLTSGPIEEDGSTRWAFGTKTMYPDTNVERHNIWHQILPGLPDQPTPRLFQPNAGNTENNSFVREDEFGEAYRGVVSVVIGRPADLDNRNYTWSGFVSDRRESFPECRATFSNTDAFPIGQFKEANPAWIIKDLLTNKKHGAKIDVSKLDTASFDHAHSVLAAEQFGLNFLFSPQVPVQERIREVVRHIDAVLYQDQGTGKIVLKLIREGETPKIHLNEDNIRSIDTLTRPDVTRLPTYQAITYNRTTYKGYVSYTYAVNNPVDPDHLGWDSIATVAEAHNSAGVLERGVISAEPMDFMGIHSPRLASKVAQRELNLAGSARTSVEITLNPIDVTLYQGDTFEFSWGELGLENVIFRVLTTDYGTLTDGSVRITAVEDIFTFEDNVIEEEPDVPPTDPAIPVVDQVAFEIPLWIRRKTFGDYSDVPLENSAMLALAAGNPEERMTSFMLARNSEEVSDSDFTDFREIADDGGLIPSEKTWNYESRIEWVEGEFRPEFLGSYWIVKPTSPTNSNREIVQITDYTSSNQKVWIARGMLDTPAIDLLSGYKMWRISDANGQLLIDAEKDVETPFAGGEVAALTHSLRGNQLPWDDALKEDLKAFNPSNPTHYRHQCEYPPKNIWFEQGAASNATTTIHWNYHSYRSEPFPQFPAHSELSHLQEFHIVISGEGSGGFGTFTQTLTRTGVESYALSHAQELSWNGLGRKSNWLIVTITTKGRVGSRDSLSQTRQLNR